MKIAAAWMEDAALRRVMAALQSGGGLVLYVGGCVRNTILGQPVKDVDISTDLRPEEVIAHADAAGLRGVPTGLAHGTVTVVAEARGFEVTTFRRDVGTDGRHATVAFSGNILDDVARRDFTMNALYAGADGTLVDPLDGLADLAVGRVRFVGDAGSRIREDYLRILRFFRFHALYGPAGTAPDPEGRAACAENVAGLAQLSRERVGAELAKLLAAPDPVAAVTAMAECGVLGAVLPGADAGALGPLVAAERDAGVPPRWLRRLRAITDADLRAALRLSNGETVALATLTRALPADEPPAALGFRHGPEAATDAILIRAARGETPPPGWTSEVGRGATARFPLTASDLMPPLAPGPELGAALARLREAWVASDFALDRLTLLGRL